MFLEEACTMIHVYSGSRHEVVDCEIISVRDCKRSYGANNIH